MASSSEKALCPADGARSGPPATGTAQCNRAGRWPAPGPQGLGALFSVCPQHEAANLSDVGGAVPRAKEAPSLGLSLLEPVFSADYLYSSPSESCRHERPSQPARSSPGGLPPGLSVALGPWSRARGPGPAQDGC